MTKTIKTIAFFMCLVIVIGILNNLFIPRWYDEWIYTQSTRDFYDLPKNSLDVLCVGSSQVVKGYSSLELYKNYGYSSYAISTGQQAISQSYAWIKESLKYQKEKVVLLEVKMTFEDTPDEQNRKSIDNMRLSKVKLESIYEQAKREKSWEKFVSYLIPVTRYHSRWKELGDDEFFQEPTNINYRGFSIIGRMSGDQSYKTLENSTYKKRVIPEERLEYLERIISLCKENQINLVFFKTPDKDWDEERFNAIDALAKEYKIPYLDFNKKELYEKIDFLSVRDTTNDNHLNVHGAEKVTNYLGEFISKNYKITDKSNDPEYKYLKKLSEEYNYSVKDTKITGIYGTEEYINLIKDEDYTVVFLKNNLEYLNTPYYKDIIDKIGLDFDKVNESNYYAIMKSGQIIAQYGSDSYIHDEEIVDERKKVNIDTKTNSMKVDGIEQSTGKSGLMVLLINNKTHNLVENCTITFEDGTSIIVR